MSQTSFTAGYKSQMKVATAVLYVTSFEWSQKFDKQDVSGTSSTTGAKQNALSRKSVTFKGEAWLDVAAMPYTTLTQGTDVAITWSADSTAGTPVINFSCTTCVLEDVSITAAEDGFIKYSFTGETNGAYTLL